MTAVLLCCYFTRLVAYSPQSGDNAITAVIALAIECGVELLLLAPAVFFCSRHKGKDLQDTAYAGSRLLGNAVVGVYLAFCLVLLTAFYGEAVYLLQYDFSDSCSLAAVLAVLGASCAYTASMGSPACGRTAVIVLFVTLLGVGTVVLGFDGKADFNALKTLSENSTSEIWRMCAGFLSRSAEPVLFILLLPLLKDSPVKTSAVFFGSKFILSALSAVSLPLVLGNFATEVKFPFLALSSCSRTKLFERMDGFILLIRIMCTVVASSAILICASACWSRLAPKSNRNRLIYAVSAICAVGAYAYLRMGGEGLDLTGRLGIIPLILLTCIAPISIILTKDIKK